MTSDFEMRKTPRASTVFPVELYLASGERLDAELLNVSTSGIFVTAPRILAAGTTIEIRVPLTGSSEAIVASGRVIHCSDDGLGIEMHAADCISLEHLRRLVADNLDDDESPGS